LTVRPYCATLRRHWSIAFWLHVEPAPLTGTYVGQMGEVPLEGTLKGTTLSFATEMTVAKLKVRILYTGTAAKDELKGTIKYGELGEGVFTGHRK